MGCPVGQCWPVLMLQSRQVLQRAVEGMHAGRQGEEYEPSEPSNLPLLLRLPVVGAGASLRRSAARCTRRCWRSRGAGARTWRPASRRASTAGCSCWALRPPTCGPRSCGCRWVGAIAHGSHAAWSSTALSAWRGGNLPSYRAKYGTSRPGTAISVGAVTLAGLGLTWPRPCPPSCPSPPQIRAGVCVLLVLVVRLLNLAVPILYKKVVDELAWVSGRTAKGETFPFMKASKALLL